MEQGGGFMGFFETDVAPWLDLPAVNVSITHDFEFYEDDLRTSIARIEFTDLTGVLQARWPQMLLPPNSRSGLCYRLRGIVTRDPTRSPLVRPSSGRRVTYCR